MCNDESPLAVFNLEGPYAIPQGADWDVAMLYKENNTAIDFSLSTARCQIRKDYDKEIILELSTDDGTIELGDGASDTPNLTLKFTSGATSAMTQYEGIYDVEVTLPSGLIKKFIEGKFQLRREVTK